MNKFLYWVGIGVLCYALACFCAKQTDRFSISRIHSALSYNAAWEVPPLEEKKQEELLSALDQKFHYLGCGGQCFAFASEDGNYVIKFFKHKIRKPLTLLNHPSLPEWVKKTQKKKMDKALYKLERDFNSYKLAYEELSEETGVFYIHLNKTKELNRSIFITDKIGIEHKIALDDIEFIVQKKGELAYTYFSSLMEKGDTTGAKNALEAMLQLIVSRCKKGIFDEDARIHRNFGFVQGKPIFIDAGRFRHDLTRKDPAIYKADLIAITGRLYDWLEETYPTLIPYLDEAIANQN